MCTDADLRHHGDAEAGPGLVDLAVNVRQGTPPEWLAELLRDSVSGLAAYPDPARARRAVADRHGRTPEEVLLTAGAAEAFVLLARVLTPRRAVVVHPQFTEPESALRAAGHEVERTILDGGFRLRPVPGDADLVMLGNPTNPTSVLHPAEEVAALARPGRTLVVDEAFMDCVPGETESLAARRLPGLVVVRSLTKTWGLAGLRCGYLLAEPDLVTALAAAQPLWSVSTPALVATEACMSPRALSEAGAWARALTRDRERLAAVLRELSLDVVPGARASFLCVRVPGALGVREALRERGYAVRRGDTFPGLGPDWLRIAVRDEPTTLGFANALTEVLPPHPRTDGPARTEVTIGTEGTAPAPGVSAEARSIRTVGTDGTESTTGTDGTVRAPSTAPDVSAEALSAGSAGVGPGVSAEAWVVRSAGVEPAASPETQVTRAAGVSAEAVAGPVGIDPGVSSETRSARTTPGIGPGVSAETRSARTTPGTRPGVSAEARGARAADTAVHR